MGFFNFFSKNRDNDDVNDFSSQQQKARKVFIEGHNEEMRIINKNNGKITQEVMDSVDRVHERTCERLNEINRQTPGAADESLEDEDKGWFNLFPSKRD